MKRIISILLVSMLMLTACGGEAPEDEQGEAPKDVITIQVGYENNPGEPFDLGINKWKELIEEKSDGSIQLDIYPSSQLGSKNEIIDQMLAGDSVVTLADGAFYAERGVEDFGIVFGPYLFDSWDEAWKLTESDWYADQAKQLEEQGLKLITSNWMYGDRHTLTKEPVRTVSDLEGMKIRVPNNDIQIKGFAELGATPTPMALGEVYTALQQGTIDGLENPLPVLYNGKFHEVAKYLTLDGHVKNFTTLVMGVDTFNSLSEEQQKIFVETAVEAGIYNNELVEEANAETLKLFEEEGVEIIEVDYEEFKEASEGFYSLPEFTKIWSENLYETVKKEMK